MLLLLVRTDFLPYSRADAVNIPYRQAFANIVSAEMQRNVDWEQEVVNGLQVTTYYDRCAGEEAPLNLRDIRGT